MEKLLLLPEQASYNFNPKNEVVSIDLEGGLSRSRKDVLGASAFVDCRWFLTSEQYQYFKAFYNLSAGRGALPFLIDLLLDQPFLEEFTAKFVADSFEMSDPRGLSFQVSAQLEVTPIIDEAFDEIILDSYINGSFLDELEKLVNVDWYLP